MARSLILYQPTFSRLQRLNSPESLTEHQLKPSPAYGERVFIFIVILLILVGGAAGFYALQDKGVELSSLFKKSEPLFSDLQESVVNIVCPEASEPFDFSEDHFGGTGLVLDQTGKILTNFHLIAKEENSKQAMALHPEGCFVLFPEKGTGYSKETYLAKPIIYKFLSPEYDLLYLQIYDVYRKEGEVAAVYPKTFKSISTEFCRLDQLVLGDELYALGYPSATEGYSLTMVKGIVSAFSSYDSFYSTANLGFGGSGGVAILPEKNCLAGIYGGLVYDDYVSYGEFYSGDSVLEFFAKAKNIDSKPAS